MEGKEVKKRREIIVICIEGCHGVAKTRNFEKLKQKLIGNGQLEDNSRATEGICTFMNGKVVFMEERFLPKEDARIFHSQALLPETKWMVHWFDRLERVCMHHYDQKTGGFTKGAPVIIIADRSPLTSCIYARTRLSAKSVSQEMIFELMSSFSKKGIQIKTFCMFGDKELVYKRVQERLKKEKWRKKCGEESKEWFSFIWDQYQTQIKWDVKIPTNDFKTVCAALVREVPVMTRFFGFDSDDEEEEDEDEANDLTISLSDSDDEEEDDDDDDDDDDDLFARHTNQKKALNEGDEK
ncbi:MAG: hypothetical protein ACTSUE_13985 [Promethearchaeota archaeon]